MSSKRVRDTRGSMLIEALVALGLLGVAAAAIGDLVVSHIRLQGTNTTTTTAISLAERELEDLRSLPYSDIGSRSTEITVGGLIYRLGTTVAADSPEPNMKSVTTQVMWSDLVGLRGYTLYAIYTNVTLH